MLEVSVLKSFVKLFYLTIPVQLDEVMLTLLDKGLDL